MDTQNTKKRREKERKINGKKKKKDGTNSQALNKGIPLTKIKTLTKKWEENDVPTKYLCVVTVGPGLPEINPVFHPGQAVCH